MAIVPRRKDSRPQPHRARRMHLNTTCAVIPNPFGTDVDVARYRHEDVPHLSARDVFAESVTITYVLSRDVFRRRKPRLIDPTRGVTDHAWLTARLEVLRRAARRLGGCSA